MPLCLTRYPNIARNYVTSIPSSKLRFLKPFLIEMLASWSSYTEPKLFWSTVTHAGLKVWSWLNFVSSNIRRFEGWLTSMKNDKKNQNTICGLRHTLPWIHRFETDKRVFFFAFKLKIMTLSLDICMTTRSNKLRCYATLKASSEKNGKKPPIENNFSVVGRTKMLENKNKSICFIYLIENHFFFVKFRWHGNFDDSAAMFIDEHLFRNTSIFSEKLTRPVFCH